MCANVLVSCSCFYTRYLVNFLFFIFFVYHIFPVIHAHVQTSSIPAILRNRKTSKKLYIYIQSSYLRCITSHKTLLWNSRCRSRILAITFSKTHVYPSSGLPKNYSFWRGDGRMCEKSPEWLPYFFRYDWLRNDRNPKI